MTKVVAFCPKISASKKIAATLKGLGVEAEHVDGTMSTDVRQQKLSWLKSAVECRILTNVRCLSEGMDVPSLDAVLFLSSRKSKVEIVQAVGRVIREASDKKYGYIIIPVVVHERGKPRRNFVGERGFQNSVGSAKRVESARQPRRYFHRGNQTARQQAQRKANRPERAHHNRRGAKYSAESKISWRICGATSIRRFQRRIRRKCLRNT